MQLDSLLEDMLYVTNNKFDLKDYGLWSSGINKYHLLRLNTCPKALLLLLKNTCPVTSNILIILLQSPSVAQCHRGSTHQITHMQHMQLQLIFGV